MRLLDDGIGVSSTPWETSMLSTNLKLPRARSLRSDPAEAASEIAEQLGGELAGVLVFCSPHCDLDAFARELGARVDAPTTGCTTAGHFIEGARYEAGVVAVGFPRSCFEAEVVEIPRLDDRGTSALESGQRASNLVERWGTRHVVGILFLDGLSMSEESVTASIYGSTPPLTLLGASAGDNLEFERTSVLVDGRFRSGAGSLMLLRTDLDFAPFRIQHHEIGQQRLVVTRADPTKRRVYEINGRGATVEYARAIGVDPSQIGTSEYATSPFSYGIAGESYLRSIRKANEDGSLDFHCAIAEGAVLRLARSRDPITALERSIEKVESEFESIAGTVALDCVLRWSDYEAHASCSKALAALEKIGSVGFYTYGEQFGALHMNQTLVGVTFGKRKAA